MKLDPSKYNIKKCVTICGKGRTSSSVKVSGYLACLNTAANLFNSVDFLFINDIETVEKIEWDLVKNLIIPLQLHSECYPSKFTYHDVTVDANVFTHKLFTQNIPVLSMGTDDFCLGKVWSTYQTALLWLIYIGFRKFNIYGVDRTGKYHEKFVKSNDVGNLRQKSWYDINYDYGKKILEHFDCDYIIH